MVIAFCTNSFLANIKEEVRTTVSYLRIMILALSNNSSTLNKEVMIVAVFRYLILINIDFLDCYFYVFTLIYYFKKIYQTRKKVFYRI